MNTTIYSILPLPTDVCNIIISYTTPLIKQVYTNGIYYEYEGKRLECTNRQRVICCIDNIVYDISVDDYNKLTITNDTTRDTIATIYLPNKVFAIKYSTMLICEYEFRRALYDVVINGPNTYLRQRISHLTKTSISTIQYANSQYIITAGYSVLTIYNDKFSLLNHIEGCYNIDQNNGVALVNDILSYKYRNGNLWYEIVFFKV
jgi:hypothetical protein